MNDRLRFYSNEVREFHGDEPQAPWMEVGAEIEAALSGDGPVALDERLRAVALEMVRFARSTPYELESLRSEYLAILEIHERAQEVASKGPKAWPEAGALLGWKRRKLDVWAAAREYTFLIHEKVWDQFPHHGFPEPVNENETLEFGI